MLDLAWICHKATSQDIKETLSLISFAVRVKEIGE